MRRSTFVTGVETVPVVPVVTGVEAVLEPVVVPVVGELVRGHGTSALAAECVFSSYRVGPVIVTCACVPDDAVSLVTTLSSSLRMVLLLLRAERLRLGS